MLPLGVLVLCNRLKCFQILLFHNTNSYTYIQIWNFATWTFNINYKIYSMPLAQKHLDLHLWWSRFLFHVSFITYLSNVSVLSNLHYRTVMHHYFWHSVISVPHLYACKSANMKFWVTCQVISMKHGKLLRAAFHDTLAYLEL